MFLLQVWTSYQLLIENIICYLCHHLYEIRNSLWVSLFLFQSLSKLGGGTSGYFGKIRHRGAAIKDNGEASGAVHIMRLFESMVDVVSQGSVRRGRFSPYLPIDHPDIMEFLEIGTEGNPIQELTHGVTVKDDWMQQMIDGDVEKRTVWAKVLQSVERWAIHIFFTDNANNGAADVYKDKNYQSMQVTLYRNNVTIRPQLVFCLCLIEHQCITLGNWKDTDAVEAMIYFWMLYNRIP